MTNNVCFKDNLDYSRQLTAVVFLSLSGTFVVADTQQTEVDPADISAPETVVDSKTVLKQAVQNEDYIIHRKNNPADPCDRGLDTYDYETSWYDETQVYVNSRFCEPALWFDNFFASDRVFREGAAGTYIRWRNEFSYDEEEAAKFNVDVSFSVELPGLQDRLRLTFENDDEALRDVTPGATQNTTNSLGLQLDVAKNTRSKFNISVSFSPRIRLRYRYTYPVFSTVTLRLTQEVQREKAVNSSRTLFDFEKLFENRLFFRSSTEGKLSEEYDGVSWLQAFVLYHRVDKKASLSYEASANGVTQPRSLTLSYRLGVRFRKNFHRKWLFYEIAPEMSWPLTLDARGQQIVKGRRSKWLVFFRLEVHFGNAYKKRYQDYN